MCLLKAVVFNRFLRRAVLTEYGNGIGELYTALSDSELLSDPNDEDPVTIARIAKAGLGVDETLGKIVELTDEKGTDFYTEVEALKLPVLTDRELYDVCIWLGRDNGLEVSVSYHDNDIEGLEPFFDLDGKLADAAGPIRSLYNSADRDVGNAADDVTDGILSFDGRVFILKTGAGQYIADPSGCTLYPEDDGCSSASELFRLRKGYGLTRVEAAKLLGVPVRTLENWEKERGVPADYVLDWACRILKDRMTSDAARSWEARMQADRRFFYSCVENTFGRHHDRLVAMRSSCASDEEFEKSLLASTDPDITSSQAYAVLSRRLDPDGKHWYRVRAMLGDKCRKAYSDCGGLLVGNERFSVLIPNGEGDGTTRYAVLDEGTFNPEMLDYFTSIEGNDMLISDYDCELSGDTRISGRFLVYYYSGIIVFSRCSR